MTAERYTWFQRRWNYYFEGLIDEVHISNSVSSKEEINEE